MADKKISTHIFIFVNPKSGSQKGKELTNLDNEFPLPNRPEISVHVCNVLDEEDKNRGLAQLKQLHDEGWGQNRSLQAWSAGGDGTVMAIVHDCLTRGIDLNRITFSCIPLGTGNDFAQVMVSAQIAAMIWPFISSTVGLIMRCAFNRDGAKRCMVELWVGTSKSYAKL
ncbi:uncharacterized protein VTP21DRAFT_7311 [Calcarisporiella thermophila]|uniref:uncharacterized protein n=1 Tax=Calcarisporiella thermophila TaxID=911321 RepID=UPI00374258C1